MHIALDGLQTVKDLHIFYTALDGSLIVKCVSGNSLI